MAMVEDHRARRSILSSRGIIIAAAKSIVTTQQGVVAAVVAVDYFAVAHARIIVPARVVVPSRRRNCRQLIRCRLIRWRHLSLR